MCITPNEVNFTISDSFYNFFVNFKIQLMDGNAVYLFLQKIVQLLFEMNYLTDLLLT